MYLSISTTMKINEVVLDEIFNTAFLCYNYSREKFQFISEVKSVELHRIRKRA